jgi:hypothetical protein
MGHVQQTGIKKCNSKIEITERNLIKIEEQNNYVVAPLTHSSPYLTKNGKALLDTIGNRFNKSLEGTPLEGTKFIISSLTRTTSDVVSLQKWNNNATKNSPHLYGGTFDIKYKRFYKPFSKLEQCHIKYLDALLSKILSDLKQGNKCWVLKEKKQPCFHVVVNVKT